MSGGIRAVALDLDGTLTNPAKEVTPAVRAALRKAAAAGVSVVLASGRPLVGMAHVAEAVGLGEMGGYALANNGALLIDWATGEAVLDRSLPRAAVTKVCALARELGAHALAYDDRFLYAEDTSARYVERERYNNSATAVAVPDLAAAITWDPSKMMVVGEPDDLALALPVLCERLGASADCFLSEPYFIEVAPPGVRKDAALAVLAERLGCALDAFMAVGDGLNDIPMLECCGFSVAMGNAYDEVKAVADWVAPSNEEDGVAAAIERFILEVPEC